MTYPFTISESERQHILSSYNLDITPEILRERVNSFRFTSDMKYVVYENEFYSTETGELMPLLEKWSLSDILHTVGDAASVGMDFIIPGSGAIVDIINGTSYFIEAIFQKDEEKRNNLFIMGAITFAFGIIPGPLQAVAVPMKRFVKYGTKKLMSSAVLKGMRIIHGSMSTILSAIPRLIKKAMNSNLGKKVLGKFATKIDGWMDNILSGVKRSYDKVMADAEAAAKKRAAGPESAAHRKAVADKKWRKKAGSNRYRGVKGKVRGIWQILTPRGRKKLARGLSRGVPTDSFTRAELRKFGIGLGGQYRYIVPKTNKVITVKVLKATDGSMVCRHMGTKQTFAVDNANFLFNTIGAPWLHRGKGKYVPFFIKRLADVMLDDGTIDKRLLNQLPDMSIGEGEAASLAYLREDLPTYEGNNQQGYVVNSNVMMFQKALIALGYSVGNTGADGKYGPSTQKAIRQFQIDNRLEDQDGTLNRITSKELAIELQKAGKEEDLQQQLFNL